MATALKKRKTDQDTSPSDQPDSLPPFTNPRPPRQTIYFPITDDVPSPPIPSTNGAAAAAATAPSTVPVRAKRSPSPESEPESETDAEEPISSLLEGLSREQLVTLLRHAASTDPATLSEIRRVVDLDPAARKLFVHGLGWDANSDALRAAFLKYGEIDDCRVITDKATGRSKGYGFVLFRHRSSAKRALRRPNKKVGSRMAICQLASSGGNPGSNTNPSSAPNPAPSHHSDNSDRKIYVANVHANFNVDRLYNFFAQYGEIEEGPLGFDRQTGKPKGFALFVYKTAEGARKALEEPVKNFEGNVLNCQKASDGGRSKPNPNSNQNPNPSLNPNTNTTPSSAMMSGGLTPQASGAVAGYDMSGYGAVGAGMAGQVQPDMSQAQNAMFGLGMGGVQPNAAFLAMLAAAMQNPGGFGMNPAMMAAMNPAFAAAAALGGAQPAVPGSTVGQVGSVGLAYPTAGFQMPPGFQGPPGFPSGTQQGSGSTGVYQAGSGVQGQLPGASTTMGGY
ncbi:UBP1-associated protein 2A [Rhynchospora pubera]|uniref:UBP1-associated protein 2A n=1 Tax=Rhynchospora pubera TaxID=906938 RepID=A0AAV8HCB3_9POAL|nr:UBP1-associated protein 2A [Rhynchospora pubera]